jgi:hypothetical protein
VQAQQQHARTLQQQQARGAKHHGQAQQAIKRSSTRVRVRSDVRALAWPYKNGEYTGRPLGFFKSKKVLRELNHHSLELLLYPHH